MILRHSVSPKPLYDWFAQDKTHRAKFRDAGYKDQTITNWKTRGIPRGEVGNVATLMGLTYEQYVELANVGKEWRQVAVLACVSLALSFVATDASSHNYFSPGQNSANTLKEYTFLDIARRLIRKLFELFRPANQRYSVLNTV